MTTLNQMTSPKSIAIVGASDNKNRIGGRPLSHMIEQNFEGTVYPVNPNREKVQGLKSYPNVFELAEKPSIINFVVPPKTGFKITKELIENDFDNFWYQPGAESKEISTLLINKNKSCIEFFLSKEKK